MQHLGENDKTLKVLAPGMMSVLLGNNSWGVPPYLAVFLTRSRDSEIALRGQRPAPLTRPPVHSPGPRSTHLAPGPLTWPPVHSPGPQSTHLAPGQPGPQHAPISRLKPISAGLQTCLLAVSRVRSVLQALSLTLHINYLCGKEKITSSSHENNNRKPQIMYLYLAKHESFIRLLLAH